MTLEEYFDAVLQSEPSRWFGSSYPTFFDDIEASDDPDNRVRVRSHYGRHVNADDTRFSFAYGIAENENFREPYLDNFPDKVARSIMFDWHLAGAFVHRTVFLSVDGARAIIPIPKSRLDLTTPAKRLELARFLHLTTGANIREFDHAIRMTGIVAANEPLF